MFFMKSNKKSVIVVFDPFVSIGYLCNTLASSIGVVGIFSPNNKLNAALEQGAVDFNYFSTFFNLTNELETDIDKIKSALINYNVLAYLIGDEIYNFEYLEKLCARLNNKIISDSKPRYDKHAMQIALQQAKLPSIKQILFTQEQAPNIEGFNFPVILKPNSASAGSKGIFICKDKQQVALGVNELFAQENWAGDKNKQILVQEFIQGREFLIDTVSLNGKHCITCIFEYFKEQYAGRPLFRWWDNFIEDSLFEQIKEYINQLFIALDVTNGFAHIEIIYYQQQFYLIEINPRLSGMSGYINKMAYLVNSIDQPSGLMQLLQYKVPHQQIQFKYARSYCLQNFGFPATQVNENYIKQLNTFYDYLFISPAYRGGDTKESVYVIAVVLLASNDKTQIENDTIKLATWELSGKYLL
jgi:predicted ATP-grasp superfamily ATP-dependent carboligase